MRTRLLRSVVEFLKREDGPTAVEYAVMLSLIIVVCLAAISVLGQKASGTFTSLSAGNNNTIQKNEQMSTERNPRTEPEGNPNVGYS